MSYIGKTSRTFKTRYEEHQRDFLKYIKNNETTIPFYNALKKYGWDNFAHEIIEKDIPNDKIDEKEKYYIHYYDTYNNGYNATLGGDGGRTSSKLTPQDIDSIVKLLQDENCLTSIPKIAEIFNVDSSVISNINNGKTWYNEKLHYPLREYSVSGLTIDKERYRKIIKDIQDSNETLFGIAKKHLLSEGQITAINNGYQCYGNHQYYLGVYAGPFPIRDTNKKIDIADQLQDIFYDILFTTDSMEKIGNKYNIAGNTLTYIANGKRRKELTKEFLTPLRKNILINREIYNKRYLKEGE